MVRTTELIHDKERTIFVVRSARVVVITGVDVGASCPLVSARVRVGAAADCELRLTDPAVSRYHLEFQVHDLGYLVRDLGSTNGTFFRGARISEALLGQGAEIRLGSTVLRLERSHEHSDVIAGQQQFGSLVGTSKAMQQLYGFLSAVAPTDSTVLLEGETGSGKELAAEEIHRNSPRRNKPFNVIDCGVLPAGLIDSELFGHERGAFSGAVKERASVFERTRGGTIFLDEIGELPLELQSRLLRVLDQRTIKRLGSNLPRRVDFRLVAATNRDLPAEVKAGRFRKDLYYRLAVVRIIIPPLRERSEDIPQLARYFLTQAGCPDPEAVLSPELLDVLRQRSWPGNVRELLNVIERAVIMADGAEGRLPPDEPAPLAPAAAPMPPSAVVAAAPSTQPECLSLPLDFLTQDFRAAKEFVLAHFERIYIAHMIQRFGRNISHIAQAAGVDRHVIRALLRKHNLEA